VETEPTVAVGSKATFVARFLGRRLEYTYELVDVVPGKRLVMRTAQGPFPMETTYTFSDSGPNRTRVTLRNRGETRGFSKLVAPLMAPAIRRASRKDLTKLKAILEAS
jgi:Polyketide cyclase / dehydrase and lipid transport